MHPSPRRTIALCALTALCEGMDLQAAGVSAAGLALEWAPSPTQLGAFFSASTFGLFFGAIIGGRLADIYGRKWVLAVSVAVFGVFSLATAFGESFESLVWLRALTGLGLGGALPLEVALASEAAEEKHKARAVAMVYSATPLGGALISLVSMQLRGDQWRDIFVVGGIVPLLVAGAISLWLKDSEAFLKVKQAKSAGQERRGQSLVGLKQLFSGGRGARTTLIWAAFCLQLMLLYLLLNWLPVLLQSAGFSRQSAAAAQIGFNIGGMFAALALAHLLSGSARDKVVWGVYIAIPVLILALAQTHSTFLGTALVVIVLGGALTAAQAFLYSVVPASYPTEIRGLGVGVALACGRIGSIAGPQLGGFLKSAGHGPFQLLIDITPIAIAGSISALMLLSNTRKSEIGADAPR